RARAAMGPRQPRGPPPSHLVTKAAAPRFEAPPVVPSRLDRMELAACPSRMTAPPPVPKPPVAPPPRVARPPVAPPPVAKPPVASSGAVAPAPLRPQRARRDDEFAAPSLDENAAASRRWLLQRARELSAAPAAAAAVAEEGAAAVTEEGAAAVTEEGGGAEEGAAAVTGEGAAVTEEGGDAEVWPRKRPRADVEAEGGSAAHRFPRARGEGWGAEAAAIRLPPVVPEALRRGGEGTEWEMAPWWPDIEVHHRRCMQPLVLAFQYWVEASAQYHDFAAEMQRLGLDGYLAAAKASYDQAWEDRTEQVQFE
ncbi:unnamed protein product, partial [Prorocentrum cordatum]